ncbi:hypothetical protein Y032_0031g2358 [Ancylostoma ceylanicum]|uniref:VWFA domain-containing protein n=1 Tax=Ancylostoma ceylanicum TaxID=53326 RepID=A0A016UQY6_9BILA|nr:hypothetical protein Y032_0031g2358 [Ancylostoma ceylanicum]
MYSDVFLYDATPFEMNSPFETMARMRSQKEFMVNVSKTMKNIRVGLVIISGASHVEIEMDYYENNKAKIDKFVREFKWGNKWTGVGVALYKARKMLEAEQTKEKIVILISDGDSDQCDQWDYYEDCPQWKKDEIAKHDMVEEADEIRRQGIRIIYVLVSWLYYTNPAAKGRADAVAGGLENMVSIKNFHAFDTSTLENVVMSICKTEI